MVSTLDFESSDPSSSLAIARKLRKGTCVCKESPPVVKNCGSDCEEGVMAASRKGKQIATRPIMHAPSESPTQTEVVRGLRLCYLRRWSNFKGYGFEVKCDEKGRRFVVDRVDIRSPAELGGLVKDDRILEVNGTSVERKTLLQVLDLIEEDPVKVDLLVIDRETEQEFAKRREVPSRKSPKVVFKTAPTDMPISPRGNKQAIVRKPPGASSGSTHIVTIGELSTEPYPPAPAHDGKLGKKGKPAKAAKPKATTKSKAANKGGTKANAAEVSKAEAELLKKFVQARATESADADQGADDGRSATDRKVRGLRGRRARGTGVIEGSQQRVWNLGQRAVHITVHVTALAERFESLRGSIRGRRGEPTRPATTGQTNSTPGLLRRHPRTPRRSACPGRHRTRLPFSRRRLTTRTLPCRVQAPTCRTRIRDRRSGRRRCFRVCCRTRRPYMPFVQMPGFYGFPYASPTYPDFSPYSANFSRYPYPGGEVNQYDEPAGEGADMPQHQAGSSRSHKEAKERKDKQGKSKTKDLTSPSARHRDH
ncbi:hypothetical protein MTO96_005910 [Rhipicephalus appendiculatus]